MAIASHVTLQNAKNLELIKDEAGYQFYKRELK